MAHTLNLEVVAEGVETEAQLLYLERYRCNQFQGYLCSEAMAAPELERLLADPAAMFALPCASPDLAP